MRQHGMAFAFPSGVCQSLLRHGNFSNPPGQYVITLTSSSEMGLIDKIAA
jgi:hypothetical protein